MADYRKMLQRQLTFNELLKIIEEKEATEKFPALIPIGEALHKRMEKIKNLNMHSGRLKRSDVKKAYRHSLSVAAYHVSCGVYAYAQVSGNLALKNALKYSYSDFYRPLESTMIGRCRQVLNAVKKVKNPAHFALIPKVIEKLQEELKKYIEFMHKPVLGVKQHARMYRQVENLLDQCLAIIQHQLDPLMVAIRCTNEPLSRKYFSWRKIQKSAGRRRKYIKKQKATIINLMPVPPSTPDIISNNPPKSNHRKSIILQKVEIE